MPSDSQQAWTVLRLLNWTREHFEQSGMDSPRLSAEVLLAHALGCPRIQLYARFDHRPDEGELATFREMIKQARGGEPVAYLVGEKEFYSLKFKVTPDVLIPRPETETLVAEALSWLETSGNAGTVWDVGCGSGCVGVSIAVHCPGATVLATDLYENAVSVATENAERHNVADRVRCRTADLLELPDDCADIDPFDVIVANPPYIAEGDPVAESVRHEPATALYGGNDGLEFLRPLIAAAPDHLKSGGLLALEFAYNHAEAVAELIEASEAFEEPRILTDIQGIDRNALAVRR